MAKTLLAIVDDVGAAQVARDLDVTPSYISKLSNLRKPLSGSLIARALGFYGVRLDVVATIRELRPDDVARGAKSAAEHCPRPPSPSSPGA